MPRPSRLPKDSTAILSWKGDAMLFRTPAILVRKGYRCSALKGRGFKPRLKCGKIKRGFSR